MVRRGVGTRRNVRIRGVEGLLLAMLLAGCSASPTRPLAATSTGSVAAHVAARAGGAAASATLFLDATFPINGYDFLVTGMSDANGDCAFHQIPAGTYILSASLAGDGVRADTVRVGDGSETTADLQLVLPSRVGGRTLLTNRTHHDGTMVTCDGTTFALAVTDSSGAWLLNGVPPGRWTVTFFQLGFLIGTLVADVPAEDSDVTLADLTLLPDPGGP
jgi:hypothetical protein